MYIREVKCPYEDNGMLQLFHKCSRNYTVYKLLKHNINEEYQRITKFYRGYSGIEYSYSSAEYILLNEYFLWLNHNDLEEMETFLKIYADCIAKQLSYFQDIFVYELADDDPYNSVNSGNIQEKTKELVKRLLGPAIYKYKREQNNSLNKGIYNSLTGEYVHPQNGTFYIDDFR